MTDIYRQNEHIVRRQIGSLITSVEGRATALEAIVGLSASPTTAKLAATLDRVIADTTVANTTTETAIYTKAVDHLDTNGYALRLVIAGTYLNNTGANSTPTCRIKFGSTTIATISLTYATSTLTRMWRVELELTSRSTSSQEATGAQWFSNAFGSPSTQSAGLSSLFAASQSESTSGAGNKTLSVTWQHDAANANLSITTKTGLLTRV